MPVTRLELVTALRRIVDTNNAQVAQCDIEHQRWGHRGGGVDCVDCAEHQEHEDAAYAAIRDVEEILLPKWDREMKRNADT